VGRLGKLAWSRVRLPPSDQGFAHVRGCPGLGLEAEGTGRVPARLVGGHLFDLATTAWYQEPRDSEAGAGSLGRAASSLGLAEASPHAWLPRPALSLRHPQALRHFPRIRGDSKKRRKRSSVCTQPLPQPKKREWRREPGEEGARKL
jgi:hypothetical protein